MHTAYSPKRVLIVDDSATIRRLIKSRLESDARLLVVGEACDAFQARELIKELSPDVLTLDVEMPGMSGLDFLRKIMRLRPMPVVMVSSETQEGSNTALEALSIGAVDCIGKPAAGGLREAFSELADLLVCAADARLKSSAREPGIVAPSDYRWNGKTVLIGSSTGGVDALETLLSGYPANCPPTLIAQHMPEPFLASFAKRLDARMAPRVLLAREHMPIEQGTVYLAPGGQSHLIYDGERKGTTHLSFTDKCRGYRPSVEVLFRSAIPWAERIVSVMLTGMGSDGAIAMLELRKSGAVCIAQDQETSTVFGMPRAAINNGAVETGTPLTHISSEILTHCSLSKGRSRPLEGHD